MPVATTSTEIARGDMTADQLALPTSERVAAATQYGTVIGGRVKNGCQVFLNVPYGEPVGRFEDPQPLSPSHRYSGEYTTDGQYAAQPSRSYTIQTPMRDRLGLGKATENPFFADIYVPSDYQLSAGVQEFAQEQVASAQIAQASFELQPDVSPELLAKSVSTDVSGRLQMAQPTQYGSKESDRNSPQPPTKQRLRPVRVFIHGGFLQFGSTSGDNYNQQFFSAEHFGEVRVLLGHRVSVFGFLASEDPFVSGNYGFKDCWLGLEWVRDNIASFGGDPNQIHLLGLSGGAHVVHQLLHYAARCSPRQSPFVTALLQSNAILAPPLTRAERADQFAALCNELGIDPASSTALAQLKDVEAHPTEAVVSAVERMGSLCTFRGVASDDGWVSPDQLEYQRTAMAGDLRAAGVKCVIAGDVRDEDTFYSVCHDVPTPDDLLPNVARYYPLELATAMIDAYPPLAPTASAEDCQARLGRILADGQVHLPVRLLTSDLAPTIPTVRYTIELVAGALGHNGKVSHGSDLAIQHVRFSVLTPDESDAALGWHAEMSKAIEPALRDDESFVQRGQEEVLTLTASGRTEWMRDARWPALRAVEAAVRPDCRA